MRFLKTAFVFVFVLLMSNAAFAASKSECLDCHKKVTPGVVKQHMEGKMAKKGVDCSSCHGSDHKKMDDSKLAKMPTPETCAGCHKTQVDQFKNGKHNLAWIASSSMPMMAHQPKAVTGEGYKGCSSCHKIGAKSEAEKKNIRYGHAQCDSCHTRHSFKKSEAQDPRACQTCHMGFDHPQWEMWSTSKHGTIWQIEGKDGKRAPVCQTCHMQKGDHNVMTSWGFLALRLPEDDKDWLNDRVAILQALGVLDGNGKPTARLDLVKAGKVARLTKEEFQKERDKMTNVCATCHGKSYAKKQLDEADLVIKDVDKIFAEAIRIVQGLYKDGILKKPAGWTFAPDLLQFYEAKSSVEQELHRMFLEYRMRTFQGAFHMNPDYMHWYGWAPMKETLQKIKDEAAKLRAEKASAKH
ncbi:MAG: cytochrome C [Nitrospirae bacterium GWB2_47_37]|nr:MAG: cytochrome C [Nitrospirae bacterium GWA2_46_11]OGW23230.1 MAG: cytochrome C [Nitrospirae bacterium GWB2_47_37]HAK89606.1 cytochrome C [Nitrospiraceae bacterium]